MRRRDGVGLVGQPCSRLRVAGAGDQQPHQPDGGLHLPTRQRIVECAQAIVQRPALTGQKVCEACGGDARGVELGRNRPRVLDVELTLPELFVDAVVVGTDALGAGRPQKADVRNRAVEDLARPADHQPASRGLAAAVHVGVTDAAPLMRVALADDVTPRVVEASMKGLGQAIGAAAGVPSGPVVRVARGNTVTVVPVGAR